MFKKLLSSAADALEKGKESAQSSMSGIKSKIVSVINKPEELPVVSDDLRLGKMLSPMLRCVFCGTKSGLMLSKDCLFPLIRGTAIIRLHTHGLSILACNDRVYNIHYTQLIYIKDKFDVDFMNLIKSASKGLANGSVVGGAGGIIVNLTDESTVIAIRYLNVDADKPETLVFRVNAGENASQFIDCYNQEIETTKSTNREPDD